ncbi:hypothetical protein LXA43DRAFT_1188240 [Ganoderma leucocontextum]|nr:hypothetical protein LXA43DRAFT_1188240 [Ganoderma leucocontextum]
MADSLYEERNPSYHEISAAIRLGDKYKIAELYSQSLKYLKHHFPSSFKSWDALANYLPFGWLTSEAIGVINLARFTGELPLLPSAFVACICAKSTASGIAHGIAREDGSRKRLSPGDLIICFEGKSNLRAATITAVLRTFKPVVSPKCKTMVVCKRAIRDVLVNLEHNVNYLLNGNPFASPEDFVAEEASGACSFCIAMVRERSLEERKDVWDRLPKLLGIDVPGWKEQPPLAPPQP